MDTPKPPKPDHLLDDLESIRQLLEEQQIEPPLLTDSLDDELQIPLLSDIIEPGPAVNLPNQAASTLPAQPDRGAAAPTSAIAPPVRANPPATPAAATVGSSLGSAVQRSLGTQSIGEPKRLDGELRAAAQLLLQEVIDDFVPQIEAELKRRLAHLLPH